MASKKCEKEEKVQKQKLKQAIQKNNMEVRNVVIEIINSCLQYM